MGKIEASVNVPPDLGEVVDTSSPEELIKITDKIIRDFAKMNPRKYFELASEGKIAPLR